MNLRQIRTKNGLSQGDVALRLGCSPNVYSRYERGERQPSIDVLMDLSKIYGVSIDYLVGNTVVQYAGLSEYEIELIHSSRQADERAREDALLLFRHHKI